MKVMMTLENPEYVKTGEMGKPSSKPVSSASEENDEGFTRGNFQRPLNYPRFCITVVLLSLVAVFRSGPTLGASCCPNGPGATRMKTEHETWGKGLGLCSLYWTEVQSPL